MFLSACIAYNAVDTRNIVFTRLTESLSQTEMFFKSNFPVVQLWSLNLDW